MVESESIIDDDTFDQKAFLQKVATSEDCPKSSCPSPEAYMKHFNEAEHIFVITLSSQLSGPYNSAVLAKNLYLEQHPDKKIAVFDSKSASIGQAMLCMKLKELTTQKSTFEEIVSATEKYRDDMRTLFVIESLETLRKNGRLSSMTAFICNALDIKPIMSSTDEGSITKIGQKRDMKKAIIGMIENIAANIKNPQEITLGIAHCNNYERAIFTKEELLKRIPFKDIIISDTRGVSSMYANNGGIVVSY